MTKYIGVKMVTAWPEEKHGKPGYAVKYEDDYISWSPKDVFEAAYLRLANATKISPEDVDRMVATVEGTQLDPKTTLVKQTTVTGYVNYDTSSCVDPANYDQSLGVQLASKKTKDKIWEALGFVLQWAKYGLKQTD